MSRAGGGCGLGKDILPISPESLQQYFFSAVWKIKRKKPWLISGFTEPGFRKLKGHLEPASQALTSRETPP
jgi:hypothetical protein